VPEESEGEQVTSTDQLRAAQLPVPSAEGLDVSNFQGKFRWDTVPGLSFGIYRLTQGLDGAGTNSPDPTAQHNHDGIKAAGLHHGAYHFLDPGLSGAAQAALFVAAHAKVGLTHTDMLWLDNENAANPGPARTAACARAFMAELDKLAPHNPRGVYTFIDYAATGHCAGLGGYPLWLAFPAASAPQPPPPWANWRFWQWGQRNGVDADAFNGTAAQLDEWIRSYAPVVPGPAVSQFETHVTAGRMSLAELAAQRGTAPMHVLRLTADHFGGFPPEVAAWGNAVFAGAGSQFTSPQKPLPAGLRLRVPVIP
jgi:lysozyme